MQLTLILQQFEIHPTVVIHKEHIVPVVAALRDVVRLTRNDNACNARHEHTLCKQSCKRNK